MPAFRIDIEKSASLLSALANTQRFDIIRMLMRGEYDVLSMSRELNLGQSATSQHLKKLRSAGLVRTRRHTQTIFYSLAAPGAARIVELMDQIFP